ncbi:hypothetical protein KUH03_17800 [Sphingobacterium sp. E70]|uniref:NosD domain-containing protein n=1 Tax=Sphingobacterium sp. E70 TaxID=2853439 RepID=UPI00211BD2DE|nr:NosD domain-containing protein [Sphingobacterium sp. E70]ULT28275.1 hypothetical protein KUH03_17800 [Sphingobacterium sp. E70]
MLEDVIIENIRTLGSKYGIYLNVSHEGAFTKVKIYNSVFQEHDVCIFVEGSQQYGMYANIIRDSYFKSSRIGIFCEGVYNINIVEANGFENMQEGYLHLGVNGKTALGNTFLRNRCEGVSDSKNGLSLSLNKATYGFDITGNYFENSFQNLLQLNGARNVLFNNNISTSDSAEAFYLLKVGKGQASITNNVGLTGIIIDTEPEGLISQIEGNSF